MTVIIRLQCDKCEAMSPLKHYDKTITDARVFEFRHGWFYNIVDGVPADLCPVCSGRDPDYWMEVAL
jgi:hypothetical protein